MANNNNLWISQMIETISVVGGYYLSLQYDGNLVINDANNNVHWTIYGGISGFLINYWPMNNLSDIVGGANLFEGFSYSFALDRFCLPNFAIHFNQGYLQIPEGVYFSGNFTVTAWIYLKSYQNNAKIFDFANGPSNNNVGLSMLETTSQMFAYVFQGSLLSNFSTLPIINLNQWYFVSFVLSNTTGYVYANGNQVGTGTLYIPNNVTRANNYIGKSNWREDSNLDAIYSDLKIYHESLTSNEILNEYNQEFLNGMITFYLRFTVI